MLVGVGNGRGCCHHSYGLVVMVVFMVVVCLVGGCCHHCCGLVVMAVIMVMVCLLVVLVVGVTSGCW